MKLDNDQNQLTNVLYHDNSALNKIKNSHDDEATLEAVAGQFEAMFLQMVLRQMRSSSDVLADKDSPFSSQQQGVFRDMYDGQLAIELAKKQNSGIANMLVQQLSPSMREVELRGALAVGSANDIKFQTMGLKEAESTSQLYQDGALKMDDALNSSAEAVASVRQVLSEAGMTTAFSQPLNRKVEL
ncbi:flagellar protein [Vibrio rotiferianus]|jgi:flagellar protein FlgJ|uniref:Flagellar protein n=1 Tax=Vibrio rotiferianus TaxID=190895 RepID=A0A510IDT8_9VIBR|nr:rod-binding protein [Vibrio rotiferianus]ASI93969.1 flagellar protein [Vibrio rotiferianus]NOH66664.1 flagellar protein [Vibrio rotiferianus]TMX42531.1 flagellar protein [Vibrio rotiferianus]TMX46353.1 flagellar protein [Vibrio rotiferianus]TMX63329.1 flagellar protein [Vibrio rotiferianus]